MTYPNLKIIDSNHFEIAGTRFRYAVVDQSRQKTTANEVVILKPAAFFDLYKGLFLAAPSKNVVEVGVFEGGSIIAFALLNPEFRFIGIDRRPPNPHVLNHIERLGLSDRVQMHYGVSQDDEARISEIVRSSFGSEAVGLVSEDASHQYGLSKRTFEILFPLLGTGGAYSLEDWSWAHWSGDFQDKLWVDAPALTNLVFEIAMLTGTRSGAISRFQILPSVAIAWRGASPLSTLSIDKEVVARGKSLHLI